MLTKYLMVAVVLSIGFGGCLSDADGPEQPSLPPPLPVTKSHWNHTLEDETVLVRINSTSGFNLTLGATLWLNPEDYIFGAFFYDDGYLLAISHNREMQVGINELRVGLGQTTWSGGWSNWIHWDTPGERFVALHGQGSPIPMNLSVEEGEIEVLTDKRVGVRYFNNDHPDWSRTYVTTHAVAHFTGTLEIEPLSNSMEIISLGVSTLRHRNDIVLHDEVCEAGESLSVSAFTDDPATVDVSLSGTGGGYMSQVFVVDWPFDLRPGCWSLPY